MKKALAISIMLTIAPVTWAEQACEAAYANGADIASRKKCRIDAEGGKATSQFGYGLVLWSAHGRTSEPKEALERFRRAARQGHFLAQVALGRFLSADDTAPDLRNDPEGYAWWVVAGERDAAAKLRTRLSHTQLVEADRLVGEFKTNHGKSK